MTKPEGQQLAMGLEVAELVQPFKLEDRLNYGITPEVFEPFRAEGRRGLAVLRWTEYGFLSVEVARHRMGLPDLGVPHVMLLGMTNAEKIALYAGIGRLKSGKLQPGTFDGEPAEDSISRLVKGVFRFVPGAFQQVASQDEDGGYSTAPRKLIKRMLYLFSQDRSLEGEFGGSVLSTSIQVVSKEERRYLWRAGFGELVEDLTSLFTAKYERAQRNQ